MSSVDSAGAASCKSGDFFRVRPFCRCAIQRKNCAPKFRLSPTTGYHETRRRLVGSCGGSDLTMRPHQRLPQQWGSRRRLAAPFSTCLLWRPARRSKVRRLTIDSSSLSLPPIEILWQPLAFAWPHRSRRVNRCCRLERSVENEPATRSWYSAVKQNGRNVVVGRVSNYVK